MKNILFIPILVVDEPLRLIDTYHLGIHYSLLQALNTIKKGKENGQVTRVVDEPLVCVMLC